MSEILLELAVGLLAGIASGVAGIGGGVVMVPAMVFLLGLSQTTAQGTSLLAILFTSVAGTVVNFRNGYVDLRQAALIGVGGMAAAQVGKTAALSIDPDLLQRLFGILVLYAGLRMAWRVWRGRQSADPPLE